MLNLSGLPLAVKDLILWDSSESNNTIKLRWLKLGGDDSGYLPITNYQVKISGQNEEIHLSHIGLDGNIILPKRNLGFGISNWKGTLTFIFRPLVHLTLIFYS